MILRGGMRSGPRLDWQQRALPVALRFWVLVPATMALVAIAGLLFTLPPGPLCDDGMVLFLEGGCDWGLSNLFFFSKLGALVAVNFAFFWAWKRRVRRLWPFAPHVLLLLLLAVVYRAGGRCDTFYDHPNGSFGQMAFELAAFAALGLALLPALRGRGWGAFLTVWIGWNALHGGLFYVWLEAAPHWTWLHSTLLGGSLLLPAVALSVARAVGAREDDALAS